MPLPSPTLPVLYSFRRCPYAMRARLALAASGTACELREVVLRAKPAGLLQASPKGTVPVLVLPQGPVLEQSLDIMRWALQRHDPLQWLPRTTDDAAHTEALIAACDGPFKQALDRCKYPERHPDAAPGAARAQAHAWLATLDGHLGASPALAGPHWGLADAAIAPFVRQFAAIDAADWQAQPWPHLQAWLEGWLQSALFERVMGKVAPWVDGTPGVPFPPP